jgi:GWxTD domain-containing protein
MDIKKLFVFWVIFLMTTGVFADNLNINVDGLNFFDPYDRTIVDVNYSVKYKDLTFKVTDDNSGAIAGLRIEVKIYNKSKILHQETFAQKIIVSSLKDTESSLLEYIDRYSFDYASLGNVLEIKFVDIVSEDVHIYKKELPLINDRFISDVEFNDYISTVESDKFKYMYRGNLLYKSNPSRIFYKETIDSLYCYFQLKGLTRNSKIDWKYNYAIEVKDSFDQKVDYIEKSGLSRTEIAYINQGINLQKLPKGMYFITVKSLDKFANNRTYSDFSIADYPGETYNILVNRDEEYQLMKYFGYNQASNSWENFTNAKKREEINKFWLRYANSMNIAADELISTLSERIEYANRKYSHHKKGWTSDRGKVYILYGPPDDIEEFLVGELDAMDKYDSDALLERKAIFNDKEYEIWRYTSKRFASYTFFDVNMNNGHKLIYVNNDDNIPVSADYKFYLGQNFDEERLK